MKINLQDDSVIVSYIQMFLKEYSGIGIKKVVSSKSYGIYTDNSYVISINSPLRVTGIYDLPTYQAVCVYMAFTYPKEGFPKIWTLDTHTNSWSSIPYDSYRLTNTMNKLIYKCLLALREEGRYVVDSSILAEERLLPPADVIYNELGDNGTELDYTEYLTWDELLQYFSTTQGDTKGLYDFLTTRCGELYTETVSGESGLYTDDDRNKVLVNIIIRNSNLASTYKEIAMIDERILSYFFSEVVTPLSEQDEIYRIQKLMYSYVSVKRMGIFDEQMTEDIENYQRTFIEGFNGTTLPDLYSGFKVTGYVDPWTEKIIRVRGVIR